MLLAIYKQGLNKRSIQIDIFSNKPGFTKSCGAFQRACREFLPKMRLIFQSFYAPGHSVDIVSLDHEAIIPVNDQFRQGRIIKTYDRRAMRQRFQYGIAKSFIS